MLRCKKCNIMDMSGGKRCEVCGGTEFVEVRLDSNPEKLAKELTKEMEVRTVLINGVEIPKQELINAFPKDVVSAISASTHTMDLSTAQIKGVGAARTKVLLELVEKYKPINAENTPNGVAKKVLDSVNYPYKVAWPEKWQNGIVYDVVKEREEGKSAQRRLRFGEECFNENSKLCHKRLKAVAEHMDKMVVELNDNLFRITARKSTDGLAFQYYKIAVVK